MEANAERAAGIQWLRHWACVGAIHSNERFWHVRSDTASDTQGYVCVCACVCVHVLLAFFLILS